MSELREIPILPGVETLIDTPLATTRHYTYAEKIRFKNGFPEKIGGWTRLQYSEGDSISGVARSIFSYILNGFRRYLVGTNSHLYDVNGSDITNITPLQTTTVAIANSLDTDYKTLNNPVYTFTTVPNRVYILDAANRFELGDTVTISGSTAVGGIPAGEINGTHVIRDIDGLGAYGYNTDTSATSNVFGGGGAAVVQRSGIVVVNAVAHGLSDGDRVKIGSATTFGGITNVQLNLEHIIRNKTTNTFDIVTAGTATSSVTGGGGAATTYQKPLVAGLASSGAGEGYGAGLYGAGLYGVSKRSLNLIPPRIWSHDRFGDLTVSCAGQQGDIYSWDATTTVAPVKVTNSPPANYVFVTDSIVVALGYDTGLATAKGNAISWSDQAGITNWTTGQSGSDTIEGAGDFISHASVRGGNLLFTQNQTYRFRYIGGQFTFQTVLLDPSVGIASQNARCVVDGVVYWMSLNNFYRWKGANIEVIPSNSSKECTILKTVFKSLNRSQISKVFCWYNPEFREIWWHIPRQTDAEPAGIIRFNIDELTWTPDFIIDRTAAEYPSVISETPYLINSTGVIYKHEDGTDADGTAMYWNVNTNRIFNGTNAMQLNAFIPNYTMEGTMGVIVQCFDYPNSTVKNAKQFFIDSGRERVSVEMQGRYWQYLLAGAELGQSMKLGKWLEEVSMGSRR